MQASWSTHPAPGPRLRAVSRILALQSLAGLAFAVLDLRARGTLFGAAYGPPTTLIALEVGLALAAGLLALAVHGGQRSAMLPAIAVELGWLGAGAWAVMSGGGAAVGGAVIGLPVLARLWSAGTWREARQLAPYDQQLMWDPPAGRVGGRAVGSRPRRTRR